MVWSYIYTYIYRRIIDATVRRIDSLETKGFIEGEEDLRKFG